MQQPNLEVQFTQRQYGLSNILANFLLLMLLMSRTTGDICHWHHNSS